MSDQNVIDSATPANAELPPGDLEVALDEPPQTDQAFAYDDEEPNLVPIFQGSKEGQRELKRIGEQVNKDFESDWEATRDYRKRTADDWKLFAGTLPKKSFPYENSANAHVPIALENVTRIQMRIFSEVFGDWNNVFGVVPIGPADDQIATDLSIHGNWQIRNQITDFKRQQHRGTLIFVLHGDVTCHSYYDKKTWLNCHEILTPDDFVVPYVYTSTKPDWSDVPHRTKILHRYRHELEAMAGEWTDVDQVIAKEMPSWDDGPDQPLHEAVAEGKKVEIFPEGKGAPYVLLQYEGWLELPGQDVERFCQVIQDYRTKRILNLRIYEQENWQDKERYNRQIAERDAYFQAMAVHQQLAMEQQAQIQQGTQLASSLAQAGETSATEQANAVQALQAMAMAPLPPPPPPPSWMMNPNDPLEAPQKPRKEPINLFAHAVCIEPLVGNLGLSYGAMQADFNRAANTLLSQYIDSATYANICWYLVAAGVKLPNPLNISPGAVNYVEGVSPEMLSKAVQQMKADQANPQMIELMNMIYGYAQSSMQAPSVLSGDPGKSGETYRGLAARIEQATKQLSVLAQKYLGFLEQILKNNAILNATFLPDDEIEMIIAQQGYPQTIKVSRHLYDRNYQVEFRADLRFTSITEKIQEADEIVMMSMKDPMLMQNPRFHWYSLKKALEARGRTDLVQLLGPPPPSVEQLAQMQAQQPPPPPGAPPKQPPGPLGPMQMPQGQNGQPGQQPQRSAGPPGTNAPESAVARPQAQA